MTNKTADELILENVPEGATGIKINEGFYRWRLKNSYLTNIVNCESLVDDVSYERSLADIKRLMALVTQATKGAYRNGRER